MTEKQNIIFKTATQAEEFEEGAALFQQYASFIGVDLSFQNFTNELNTIDQQYNKPGGALLIAYSGTLAIGCVGIRKLDDETAELKRMFIKPEYHGQKAGHSMLERIITIAKELGYKKIRLDTLSTMLPALKLYRLYGFYEIPAYCYNPIEGTVYMEKQLN